MQRMWRKGDTPCATLPDAIKPKDGQVIEKRNLAILHPRYTNNPVATIGESLSIDSQYAL